MSPQTVLLEQPTEVPSEHLPFARRFIAVCRFTYAKSVPEAPHEYLVRRLLTPDLQADFDTFAALIGQHGYRGRFQGATFTYLNVVHEDGSSWRYWQSSSYFPPDPDGMLNRANNEAAPMRPLDPQLTLETPEAL